MLVGKMYTAYSIAERPLINFRSKLFICVGFRIVTLGFIAKQNGFFLIALNLLKANWT